MSDFSKIKIARGSHVLREQRHSGLSAPFLKYNHLDCDKTFPLTLVHPTFVASFFCSYSQLSLSSTHLVAITCYRDCCLRSACFLIITLHRNTYFTLDSSRCISTNSSTPPYFPSHMPFTKLMHV